MSLNEVHITKAILQEFLELFIDSTEVDVALVGGGPANLVAATYLAKKGVKTVIFEKKLSLGGGIWGGGMMFPRIVVQEEARRILEDFQIKHIERGTGYYLADAIETVGKMISAACDAGVKIFNLMSVEDVMIREEDEVVGLVLNWTAVNMANLHVDPMAIAAKVVVDGTGHDAEVCRIVEKKISGKRLKVHGEKPMWADVGERILLDTTKEVYPGLIVSGMAANAVAGGHRMGPIFGGMMLSGEKAAQIALEKLGVEH
ncbi:MAG: sulfide-dependent adenosine diphosphate thiazole synthase [Actinomycetota bacterium]|nr:sulfide-dependent adenosine diphosphate thiazole synthase [Actinomycetota bacterium]